jgi:hypothetical protein
VPRTCTIHANTQVSNTSAFPPSSRTSPYHSVFHEKYYGTASIHKKQSAERRINCSHQSSQSIPWTAAFTTSTHASANSSLVLVRIRQEGCKLCYAHRLYAHRLFAARSAAHIPIIVHDSSLNHFSALIALFRLSALVWYISTSQCRSKLFQRNSF